MNRVTAAGLGLLNDGVVSCHRRVFILLTLTGQEEQYVLKRNGQTENQVCAYHCTIFGLRLYMPDIRKTNQRHVKLCGTLPFRYNLHCFISADKYDGEDRKQTTLNSHNLNLIALKQDNKFRDDCNAQHKNYFTYQANYFQQSDVFDVFLTQKLKCSCLGFEKVAVTRYFPKVKCQRLQSHSVLIVVICTFSHHCAQTSESSCKPLVNQPQNEAQGYDNRQ